MSQTIIGSVKWVVQLIIGEATWLAQTIASAIRRSLESIYRLSLTFRPTTLTLTEESGLVRVVAFRGNTVIGWNFASLEDAPTSPTAPSLLPEEGNLGTNEVEESSLNDSHSVELGRDFGKRVEPIRLRRLMAEMPTRRLRLVTSLPIYASLLRHFPLPKKVGKRYLERMIIAEVLDAIPFKEEEVDISWRLLREYGAHGALAIAVPKANIDAQVKLCSETGLKPKAAYAKATALALMAGADDAIVVHLESEHVAVVLVREGRPLVVHQQPLPRQDATVDAQCNTLSGSLEQVLGYYLNIGTQDYSDELPVVLTGQLAGLEDLVDTLPRFLGRQVRSAKPTVNFPDQFPWNEYSANIGLFLADSLRGKSSKRAGAVVNVLPQRHRPNQAPVVPAVTITALVSLGVLAFLIGGAVQDQQEEAHRLSLVKEIRLDQEREQRLAANIEQKTTSRLEEARGQELALDSGLAELKRRMAPWCPGLAPSPGRLFLLGYSSPAWYPRGQG